MALTKTRSQRKPTKPKRTKRQAKQDPVVQTFMQHIVELRKRLFWTALLGLVLGTVVYSYNSFFMRLIMAPLRGEKLIYLTPGGGFAFTFSVIVYTVAIFLLPFLVYQLYAFLRPAIPTHTKKLSVRMALASLLLMAGGVTFGYFVAVPSGLQFLTTFASDYVAPSLTAESYLNFLFGYVLGIGVLFQLPLVLLLIHWIYPLDMKTLLRSERFIIVLAFVLAAIISPTPDALNQSMIAVPIIIIYQFGVIAVWISIRNKAKQAKKAALTEASQNTTPPTPQHPVEAPLVPVFHQERTALAPTAPLTSARPLTAVSIDGFRPARQGVKPESRMHKQFPQKTMVNRGRTIDGVKKTTQSQTPSNRGKIAVPMRKSGLISDFSPIHRSAIDIGR